MASKADIERIQLVIAGSHGCGSIHVETAFVYAMFPGEICWKGEVEVFNLKGHPTATRAYAWSKGQGQDANGEVVTVLEVPPIISPEMAVRSYVLRDLKKAGT